MNKLLNVSSSPHVRSGVTTKNIMYDVAIAMIPATVWGVMQFGLYSLLVVAATVLSCVLSEYVFEVLMKKPVTISDGSALVTGMILGLNMPPSIPDAGFRRRIFHYRRQAALRRPWTELYEPGVSGTVFPFDLLCRFHEFLY